jgi:TonB family protein
MMIHMHFQKHRSGKLPDGNRKHLFFFTAALLLSILLASVSTSRAEIEYRASEVDSKPRLIRQMPVTYPYDAREKRIEGEVIVKVLIDTKGKVSKVETVTSEPEGIFDENAIKSVKNWQFRPGILGGELVSTWIMFPLTFTLE